MLGPLASSPTKYDTILMFQVLQLQKVLMRPGLAGREWENPYMHLWGPLASSSTGPPLAQTSLVGVLGSCASQ